MKKLLTMAFMVMVLSTTAQRLKYDTVPGYIITIANDTVAGHFQITIVGEYYSSYEWYKKVSFIDSTGSKLKYEAKDINGYGFNLDSTDRYVFRTMEIVIPNKAGMFKDTQKHFVLMEQEGPITLYRHYHEEVGLASSGWYIERYLQKGNGPLILLKRNNMTQKYKLGETIAWFEEFPESADYLEKELNALGLKKLLLAYNTWKNTIQ